MSVLSSSVIFEYITNLEKENKSLKRKVAKLEIKKDTYGHKLEKIDEFIETRKDHMIPEHYEELKYILNECDTESSW